MIINKKSWHFRLNKHYAGYNGDMPTNLCGYFWTTVFSVIKTTFLVVGSAFIAFTLMYGLGDIFTTLFGLEAGVASKMFIYSWPVLIVAFLVAATIIFVTDKWGSYKRRKSSQPKQPDGIVVAFVKAKKSKVCPLVEYK